jgi:hypothetical protein
MNLYAYAYNNPLRWVDPTGHEPCPPGSEAVFCSSVTAELPRLDLRFFWDSWMNRQRQLTAAQATMSETLSRMQAVIPKVCGGGGFGYGGLGFGAGTVRQPERRCLFRRYARFPSHLWWRSVRNSQLECLQIG